VTAPVRGPRGAACQIAVVGGGLSGAAAAAVIARHGYQVDLFEARHQLGGRAASFRDRVTGQIIDLGQHVSMGCCTCLADFCRDMGLADCFTRYRTLHFLPPTGPLVKLQASAFLPAPLHLLPALLRMGYLTWRDRLAIARALVTLPRTRPDDDPHGPTIGQWLRDHGQSERAIEWFWQVILVSALGQSLDRVSLSAARKVVVHGLLATRDGYELLIPNVPLAQLCGTDLEKALRSRGVRIHLGAVVARLTGTASEVTGLTMAADQRRTADHVVVAVPWWQLPRLLPPGLSADRLMPDSGAAAEWPTAGQPPDDPNSNLSRPRTADRPAAGPLRGFEPSPITSVHLWYDRSFMPVRHAALLGRLSQWVFQHGQTPTSPDGPPGQYHYQVVISASHGLRGVRREAIVERVAKELRQAWPDAPAAKLLRGQVVTQPHAVFSPRPGLERLRPAQRTDVVGLTLCGDWTATGWPATMESAVRSGYLAAQAVLDAMGTPAATELRDPQRGTLARWLLGSGVSEESSYSGRETTATE
jgi:squalene-associated FAD-dependent desaturase